MTHFARVFGKNYQFLDFMSLQTTGFFFFFFFKYFFYGGENFSLRDPNKKRSCNFYKGLTTNLKKKKTPNSLLFEGKKVQIAIFRLQTLPYHQYIARVSKKNLLFSRSCSQVWLNPLVEDRQSTYIMKLEIE